MSYVRNFSFEYYYKILIYIMKKKLRTSFGLIAKIRFKFIYTTGNIQLLVNSSLNNKRLSGFIRFQILSNGKTKTEKNCQMCQVFQF
ncbi:hypothetical protein D0T53_07720 [Dysgonomonas sp. 216]|nr:hypothetical protein [Dysgonomonas sp. 216]